MKFILGKKLDMTQVWLGDRVMPVTRLVTGPCVITQIKSTDKDGYLAVQLGFGERKEKNINKAQKGHLKNFKEKDNKLKTNLRYLREFRINNNSKDEKLDIKIGDVIDVGTFVPGDIVKVTGVSKGKGFQGVVKRHGFSGMPKSHGTKDQLRMPGSIGATGPAHVFKGQRMPGRMGADKVTVTNLEIIKVDEKNNILLIKGAVPGARNGLLLISGPGELKIKEQGTENKEQKIDNKKSEDVESNLPVGKVGKLEVESDKIESKEKIDKNQMVENAQNPKENLEKKENSKNSEKK